tara:strand:- start:1174 stop:1302 length:129 start_codon:yes stop_codon:yes gene_type:complete
MARPRKPNKIRVGKNAPFKQLFPKQSKIKRFDPFARFGKKDR